MTTNNFLDFKPREVIKIKFLDMPIENRMFRYYKKEAKGIFLTEVKECPICESERIKTRFEILDL